MGPYPSNCGYISSLHCQTHADISVQLQAFWELEELKATPRISPEDSYCEEHFLRTHQRDSSGRYMVRLPFAITPDQLGNNRAIANRRFHNLEARLKTQPQLRKEYANFMKEYEELQHMTLASRASPYVIPHFGIMQGKLRVVFDASCTSTNKSLNEILFKGPKLQADISDVLMHFRMFPIAITADIAKMYRQILVHPEDRVHQHIFWREDSSEKLAEYELATVTYGEASSAFLAIRTILQLLRDEGKDFPLATQRLTKGIYVDDIATGVDSEEEAVQLCHQLVQLFSRGGFPLGKWSSNKLSVLPAGCLPTASSLSLEPNEIPTVKVLGLIWNPSEDKFLYAVQDVNTENHTKRSVLSFIARIFDPLGFLAPVVFAAKSFLQEIWKSQLGWDDSLPPSLAKKWAVFIQYWSSLAYLRIPRYMRSRGAPCNLVGFCDASTQGYAAVLYLQVESRTNQLNHRFLRLKLV